MNKIKSFNPRKSIKRAAKKSSQNKSWHLTIGSHQYQWKDSMERVHIIRERLPYEAINVVSDMASLSLAQILKTLDIPQTTYNKKKREHSLLCARDSEIVLLLAEVIEFGIEVFNQEQEKFKRWLKKPNAALNGEVPSDLFDSLSGIEEVKKALNRIEYGQLA